MKHLLALVGLLLCLGQALYAQKVERYESEDNQELQEYDKEFTYGINLNNQGGIIGGIHAKFGWQRKKEQTQYHFISTDLVSLRHDKELLATIFLLGNSYRYNKKYHVGVGRVTFGREILVFPKAQEEGVQITWLLGAGPSLALLKPYYVLYGDSDTTATPQPFDESMEDGKIWGAGGFFRGFNKSYSELGMHMKTSLNFEYGQFKSSVTGIEVGVLLEQFSKPLVIVARTENHSFFPTFFVNLYFGFR